MLAQISASSSRRLDLGGESCEAGDGTGPSGAKRRELRLCGAPRAGPRKWLRLDAAEHDAAPTEVQLGVIADEDQLERDDTLAGRGWLDEQAPIELERERTLAASADGVHLGDHLGPPAIEPVGGHQAADSHVRPSVIVVGEKRRESVLGLVDAVELNHLPQLALHRTDHRLDLAAALRPMRLAQRVVDQLLVEELLAAGDIAPHCERRA